MAEGLDRLDQPVPELDQPVPELDQPVRDSTSRGAGLRRARTAPA